jgi:hypothetical protein
VSESLREALANTRFLAAQHVDLYKAAVEWVKLAPDGEYTKNRLARESGWSIPARCCGRRIREGSASGGTCSADTVTHLARAFARRRCSPSSGHAFKTSQSAPMLAELAE